MPTQYRTIARTIEAIHVQAPGVYDFNGTPVDLTGELWTHHAPDHYLVQEGDNIIMIPGPMFRDKWEVSGTREQIIEDTLNDIVDVFPEVDTNEITPAQDQQLFALLENLYAVARR